MQLTQALTGHRENQIPHIKSSMSGKNGIQVLDHWSVLAYIVKKDDRITCDKPVLT